MKKAYINPETNVILLMAQTIVCASVDGFNSTLSDNDEESIDTDKMLSRRKSVWDDGMEEEEEEMY